MRVRVDQPGHDDLLTTFDHFVGFVLGQNLFGGANGNDALPLDGDRTVGKMFQSGTHGEHRTVNKQRVYVLHKSGPFLIPTKFFSL